MGNNKNIGDRGDFVNFSVASRAVHVTADLERVEKYDEYPAKAKKQKMRHLLWFMLFLAPTITLIMKGHPFWAIIPGIIAAWHLLWFFLMRKTTPTVVYEQGLLINAVITNTSPLQIVAMAEVQRSEEDPVCWGLKRFMVNELPEHEIKVGERIPCAAMFGAPLGFAGIWGEFEPHPICWATGDKNTINAAINAIDETEWQILEKLTREALENDDIDDKYAYFNEDLSPRTDLYEKPEKASMEEKDNDDDPADEFPVVYTEDEMDCVEQHIEKNFGESKEVFHEIVSPDIHLDIVIVPPTSERNFYTLVTMGMGAYKMNIPEEFNQQQLERAELLITLPANWNIKSDDEKDYWPIRWLKVLARLPITNDTWLGWGHAVPNGEPFAENTQLAGIMLTSPYVDDEKACKCMLPNGDIVNFYQVIPLYAEEMDFKIDNGAEKLLDLFDDDFTHIVNISRKNYAEQQ